jgi:hypothetical protein
MEDLSMIDYRVTFEEPPTLGPRTKWASKNDPNGKFIGSKMVTWEDRSKK